MSKIEVTLTLHSIEELQRLTEFLTSEKKQPVSISSDCVHDGQKKAEALADIAKEMRKVLEQQSRPGGLLY